MVIGVHEGVRRLARGVRKSRIGLWTLPALLTLGSVCCGETSTPSGLMLHVSGQVMGASGKHTVHVALWAAAGFLEHPVQEIRIAPGAATEYSFAVPPGRWALSAYEDVNENGKLDMGHFGPKEPSGFWRPFHGWRRPRFDDVAVEVEKDQAGIEIRLK